MRSFEALPDVPLAASGALSTASIAHGARDIRGLGRLLRDLPYGRTSDRADYAGVLAAGRGSCSSKHAFLAATAGEQAVPIELVLGLYEMSEANTPGIGGVLEAAGFARIPEAHCYVRCDDQRIDVTRAAPTPREAITFLHEEVIRPDQIGDDKVRWHQEHLRRWCQDEGHSWQRIWRIREECIAALSVA